MALDTATILEQIDDVLGRLGRLDPTGPAITLGRSDSAETASVSNAISSAVAALDRLTPPGHHYRESAHEQVAQNGATNPYTLAGLIGLLRALRADVESGYMASLVELVHADLFADFLAMADELQRNGFKDAAAVIAGSTLEEHLRKLAQKAGLPITNSEGQPLKASRLNDDLRDVVYNALEQRSVQAWLDIRNAAAHGEYDQYDHKQVAGLILSVGDFMTRHSA
jgi:hypothetical protein